MLTNKSLKKIPATLFLKKTNASSEVEKKAPQSPLASAISRRTSSKPRQPLLGKERKKPAPNLRPISNLEQSDQGLEIKKEQVFFDNSSKVTFNNLTLSDNLEQSPNTLRSEPDVREAKADNGTFETDLDDLLGELRHESEISKDDGSNSLNSTGSDPINMRKNNLSVPHGLVISTEHEKSSSDEQPIIPIHEKSILADDGFPLKESRRRAVASPRRAAFASSKRSPDIFANRSLLERIAKSLPAGVLLDPKGNLSGKYSFTEFTSHGIGRPLEETFLSIVGEFVKEDAKRAIHRPRRIGGIMIAALGHVDYFRTNYKFSNADNSTAQFLALHQLTEEEKLERIENVATAIMQFVQDKDTTPEENEKATLVVSALLTQQTCFMLANTVLDKTSALAMLSAQTTTHNKRLITIKDHHGIEHEVDTRGIGGATFSLSRVGPDFEINLELPGFAGVRNGREKEIPLHHNGAISINMSTKLIVNADLARRGIVAVKFPKGIDAEYSGQLTVN